MDKRIIEKINDFIVEKHYDYSAYDLLLDYVKLYKNGISVEPKMLDCITHLKPEIEYLSDENLILSPDEIRIVLKKPILKRRYLLDTVISFSLNLPEGTKRENFTLEQLDFSMEQLSDFTDGEIEEGINDKFKQWKSQWIQSGWTIVSPATTTKGESSK